jgi:hypothetical protein
LEAVDAADGATGFHAIIVGWLFLLLLGLGLRKAKSLYVGRGLDPKQLANSALAPRRFSINKELDQSHPNHASRSSLIYLLEKKKQQ